MRILILAWTLFVVVATAKSASAQSGLRESLDRLDRNENGKLEPEEITPLARPYLERVARARRISMDWSTDIDKWQEAARIYFAMANGISDDRIRADLDSSIKAFGPIDDEPVVPEFGLPKVKYPYTQDDLEEADELLDRYDRNDDGFIDRHEARRVRWTHRDPFEEDYDHDGRLGRMELSQRYARRRLLDGASDELIKKSRRVGNGIRPSRDDDDDDRNDSYWRRRGGSRYYFTASVMDRFDKNRNGRLEPEETLTLGIPAGRIDADRDGEVSRDELHAYLGRLQDEVGDDAKGIPTWFYERDLNRDDQVTMGEFTDQWTDDRIAEFAALDANDDGILTTNEVTMSAAMMGGSFTNTTAEVLPPRKTVISEITIDEDLLVADLDVQLSITHSLLSQLDGYLVSPDGDRIELFTSVGGTDDNFSETVFDDQASTPITKGRAPFEGHFLPEAVLKREPGLSRYNGKSASGTWQLVIAGARNERFGILHRWAIVIQPMDRLAPREEQVD